MRVLHAADFHLDSAFAGGNADRARQLRREARELPGRLADYVNQNRIDLVLLAGDLFDSGEIYRDTLDALTEALGKMDARVFIAPGNHDFYSSASPYAAARWPENVHIFRSAAIERVVLPELSCAVYGAAFTGAAQETSLLSGFAAPEDGLAHLMVLHADVDAAEPRYDPVTRAEIAASGLDYLALGHRHACTGIQAAGHTAYAYSGCIAGRGFDETGEKGFLAGTVERGRAAMAFVPFARRRYETLRVDVTDADPADALERALPEDTARDLYRITFTGETDERGIDGKALHERFAPAFFALELRDETRIRQDVWARASEDSLRGLFLRELRERYDAAAERERPMIERAARFGLAALDKREL